MPDPRRFPVRARLGDDIDDFCIKCKRIMNHAVVSLLGEEPAKVRCRTCHSDHDFRHELAPPPKVDPRKAALFNQVLEKVTGDVPGVPMDGAPLDGVPMDPAALMEKPPVKVEIVDPLPAEDVAAAGAGVASAAEPAAPAKIMAPRKPAARARKA